ncbi:MAG: glycosyltransferase [Balneola sp.]
MKEFLILLTSNFPYGTGESFLEVELKYLAQNFSTVIIVPTKKCDTTTARKVPQNCILDSSLVNKINAHNTFQRIFTKIRFTLSFPFLFKELAESYPRTLKFSVLERLMLFSYEAILTKNTLEKAIKSHQFQNHKTIVYSYWCSGSALGATLLTSKLPVISRIHRGDLYEELYSENYIPFRKITFSRLKAVFSISENGLSYLSEKYPSLNNKFFLSRLGISITNNFPDDHTDDLDTFVIVSCSFVHKVKRIDKIAESLIAYALKNPEAQILWHHFGSGDLLDELLNQVETSPDNLKVKFHGYINNKSLLNWYENNRVDLFINLSESEGIPVSIMEAYNYGIPAIATDVGGTSELVSKENGWLVKKEFTKEDVLNSLEEAIKNKNLRNQKSKAARRACVELFDSNKNYPKFIDTIKSKID